MLPKKNISRILFLFHLIITFRFFMLKITRIFNISILLFQPLLLYFTIKILRIKKDYLPRLTKCHVDSCYEMILISNLSLYS